MATLERADSSLTLAVGQTQSKAGDWVWEVPSEDVVAGAAQCSLYDQWGNKVDFNSLLPTEYPDKEGSSGFTRLVVFFIGHWWCGLCHDYMLRSIQHLDPEALERAGIRVAIISSGSWKVIASYRERFKVPFPAFVDRGTRLYRTLGMQSAVPNIIGEVKRKERPGYHSRSFAQQATSGLIVSALSKP
jgi:hypothetical protein